MNQSSPYNFVLTSHLTQMAILSPLLVPIMSPLLALTTLPLTHCIVDHFSDILLFSCLVVWATDCLWVHGLQHARLPFPRCPSPSPGTCSNSCPLSQSWDPTISSSVIPFSSCLQSFPASGSFLMRRLFASGGQSIGVSTSASAFPINIQDWFPSGLTSIYISHIYQGYTRDALILVYMLPSHFSRVWLCATP